jgi:hypothetical protein
LAALAKVHTPRVVLAEQPLALLGLLSLLTPAVEEEAEAEEEE